MPLPKTVINNLKFLLVEVENQVNYLIQYFNTSSTTLAHKILDRSGYAYTLSLRIQNGCFIYLSHHGEEDHLPLRALSNIATDLERIAQLCRGCIHQSHYFSANHKIDLSLYLPLMKEVIKSMKYIEKALLNSDTELALKLGSAENKLDDAYKKLLKKFTSDLKKKKYTEDLITALFIGQLIEQMGDCLLKISESIISSNVGQPMDFQRYLGLRESLTSWQQEQAQEGNTLKKLAVHPVAETRSGSIISSIHYTDENKKRQQAIFKDGETQKLKEEVKGIERWHRIQPGVAPQVYTFKESGNAASVLIEHLHGITFEQIVLTGSLKLIGDSMKALKLSLNEIWSDTKKKKYKPAHFIQQIRKRLPSVYAIHPEFRERNVEICGLNVNSFQTLLSNCEKIEEKLKPPFSVFIHGDFNVDNVLYNPSTKHINFIDLHRSTYFDYIQDVSVFMISNYRLQVMDPPVRLRVRKQALDFYKVARQFSEKHDDTTFELRLALGLARSFMTSTRFIMDKTMARRMFDRSNYILRHIAQANLNKPERYRLPIKELFSD